MNKPHKHAELIKAWADGAKIEFLNHADEWTDCNNNKPHWDDITQYRVKPEQSDVEKFGIQVGDIWESRSENKYCITKICVDYVDTLKEYKVANALLNRLIFRRGEVNLL